MPFLNLDTCMWWITFIDMHMLNHPWITRKKASLLKTNDLFYLILNLVVDTLLRMFASLFNREKACNFPFIFHGAFFCFGYYGNACFVKEICKPPHSILWNNLIILALALRWSSGRILQWIHPVLGFVWQGHFLLMLHFYSLF